MRLINFDFIGRRRLWFAASGLIMVVSVASLAVQQLNLSIEFRGGSAFTVSGTTREATAKQLEDVAEQTGAREVQAQLVREGDRLTGAIVQTESIEPASPTERAVADALKRASDAEQVEVAFVGPTFGERVSRKMVQALIVFLIMVVLYLSVRLEFKMAVAAMIAMVHDLVLTAGVYSLFRFTVSPATVIALLTIMGYSLYDTVIVFDRVHETSARLGGPGRRTYAQAVNTSMNEVFWRSINTTITSALPVAALLVIGSQVLGAATLEEVALALFIGMITGAYSSLFLAGPVLAGWKEREPKLAELARRAERRRVEEAEAVPVPSGDGEPEAAQSPAVSDEGLSPRGYVRGPGRTPRSKRR